MHLINKTTLLLKQAFMSIKGLVYTIMFYFFDAKKYYFSAIYPFSRDIKKFEGKIIKLTHSMEKRLSFENYDPSFGKEKAYNLLYLLEAYGNKPAISNIIGLWSIKTLEKFCHFFLKNDEKKFFKKRINQIKLIKKFTEFSGSNKINGGVKILPKEKIFSASKNNFEEFSQNRYSIRNFCGAGDNDKIKKAVSLALKCPSTCNIQPIKIYLIQQEQILKKILSLQRGNKGFSENIPQLIIITSNLSLYSGVRERNQCYIDGGIFALSLSYSLQYFGIASCMLNWASTISEEKKIKKMLKIPNNKVVILMMAIGRFPDKIVVPTSIRRHNDEVLSII